jgi:hypothetical protein
MKRIFFLLILLVGCNELTSEEKLMGVDKNHNGIRDDVDEYIVDVSKNNDEKNALTVFAKYTRKIFSTYKEKEISNANTVKWLDSSTCLFYIMGYKRSNKLEAKIQMKYFNTKEQLVIFKTKSRHFSGEMKDVSGTAVDVCEFKLEGKYED